MAYENYDNIPTRIEKFMRQFPPGVIIPKPVLYTAVWGGEYNRLCDNTIRANISYLRKSGFSIRVRRGKGYVWDG
jgi:DNA-binding response OmpR family regulator